MHLFSDTCSKFRAFNTGHLDITSTTRSATLLAIACLASLVILLNLSCSSPTPTHTRSSLTPTAPTPTNTPPPTNTPTPTVPPTSTPLPPVALEKPEDGSCVECESEVTLCWSCVYELLVNEYYRLKVWAKGQEPSVYYHKEKQFTLPTLSPGEYNWTVAIVRSMAPDAYEQMSEESERHHFHIVPPPVVYSMSPTSTLQGKSVPVVINGENLTASLALTIGVPLQVTFVDSTTITATIPMTLEVGKYPVIVRTLTGKEIIAPFFFMVNERPPIASPTLPPPQCWNPLIPVPTAPPGYNPSEACVVTPCAPAPQLVGPDEGAELKVGSTVEFRWTWICCLPPGWKFAIRLSSDTPPHSWQYVDVPCEGGASSGYYQIEISPGAPESRITAPGTYYWNIAVTRSLGDDKWERLSQNSDVRPFTVVTPPPIKCPVPPCP